MAKCSICETETQLQIGGRPLCVTCVERLQWTPRQYFEQVMKPKSTASSEPRTYEG
jgi:hypothetical protein